VTAHAPAGHGAAVRFPLPPLLFAVPLAAGLIAHRLVPLPLPLPGDGRPGTTVSGVVLVAPGIGFQSLRSHDRAGQGTTVVPHRAVTRLIITGNFRISRNPTYTGHVVAVLGVGLWVGSWWPLIGVPLSVQATPAG
jgi:protein-S-isoprenylcysteine O-methyltransferase Ste14